MRTRRRRISPRAKQRVRAIKDFWRRLLGIRPQLLQDIKINSSISINDTDFKDKIAGLEQQLSEVSRRLREMINQDYDSRKEWQTQLLLQDVPTLNNHKETITNNLHEDKNDVLSQTSDSHRKSGDFNDIGIVYQDSKRKDIRPQVSVDQEIKMKKNVSKSDNKLHCPKEDTPNLCTASAYDNSASSNNANTKYHCLKEPRTGLSRRSNCSVFRMSHYQELKQNHVDRKDKKIRAKSQTKKHSPEMFAEDNEGGIIRQKRTTKENLIENINQQHRPVIIYRETDKSQLSAPVCRDETNPSRKDCMKCSDLYLCCFNCRKKPTSHNENEISDLQSIDTHLYHGKHTHHRYYRIQGNNFNDSSQYDLVPVREKTSPKSRNTNKIDIPYGLEHPSNRPQYFTEMEDYVLQKSRRNAVGSYHGNSQTDCSYPPKQIKRIKTQCHHHRHSPRKENYF